MRESPGPMADASDADAPDGVTAHDHTERELRALLTALLRHGDPKLIRAAEVNLRSLLKQARTSSVPWQHRPPGHFEPPSD